MPALKACSTFNLFSLSTIRHSGVQNTFTMHVIEKIVIKKASLGEKNIIKIIFHALQELGIGVSKKLDTLEKNDKYNIPYYEYFHFTQQRFN
jgi:hypothetical protein